MKRNQVKKVVSFLMVVVMIMSIITPSTIFAGEDVDIQPIVAYTFENGIPDGMELKSNGTGRWPELVTDNSRGQVLELKFGIGGNESYAEFSNPYAGLTSISGAAISFWVKIDENAANLSYDNIIGFAKPDARLTLQSMPYLCSNNAGENWIDIKSKKDPFLKQGVWAHMALTIGEKDSVNMYVNGEKIELDINNGSDYNNQASLMLGLLSNNETKAYLGNGSFWGSQDCRLDDIRFYDEDLSQEQIKTIYNETVKGEEEVYDLYDRVSVHDPSIVRAENGMYYAFGSHLAAAKSVDLKNWEKIAEGVNESNPLFNTYKTQLTKPLEWTQGSDDSVWAADVFYNKQTKKYNYYACSSVWATSQSVIWFAESDNIEGPYTYKESIIYSGFNKSEDSTNLLSYKNTNIDSLIKAGKLTGLIAGWFYSNGNYNNAKGSFPNAIDPTVFYDKDDKLWMTYGSYSGGIFVIELDEETGIPKFGESQDPKADAYFGKQIVSYKNGDGTGEGPYIMYDQKSGYYYLYLTYGGLDAKDGYNIRMYRSETPDGNYVDVSGKNGLDGGNTGTKLFGNYQFECLSRAYLSGGHSSAFEDNGKLFQVYHTRFADGVGAGHQVRVHQMLVNEDGWTVVMPYEYSGETVEESGYSSNDIIGSYQFINHGNVTKTTASMDTISATIEKTEYINLEEDGRITGSYTGNWTTKDGSYFGEFLIEGVTYKGAFLVQKDESKQRNQVMTFAAVGTNNSTIWGSKLSTTDKEAVELVENLLISTIPNKTKTDLNLPAVGLSGTVIKWSSNKPDVITGEGKVYRSSIDQTVTLTATLEKGIETRIISFEIIVKGISENVAEPMYLYTFEDVSDGIVSNNGLKGGKEATIIGSGKIIEDNIRGRVFDNNTTGSSGMRADYLQLPDVFSDVTDGFTVGMWVKADSDSSYWGPIFTAYTSNREMPLTQLGINLIARVNSNGYVDTTDGSDFNTSSYNSVANNNWHYVAYTVLESEIVVYLDGKVISITEINGTAGKSVGDLFSGQLSNLQSISVGGNAFWDDNDVNALYDDVAFYNLALSEEEIELVMNKDYAKTDEPEVTPAPEVTPTPVPVATQAPKTAVEVKDIKAAIENNKDIIMVVKDKNKLMYSWKFTAEGLKSSNKSNEDIKLNIVVDNVTANKKVDDIIKKDKKNNSAILLDFEQEKELVAQAEVKIYVGNQNGIIPGSKAYVYSVNEKTGKLETIPYGTQYSIDSEGYITLNLLKGGDYVILKKRPSIEIVTTLFSQISVKKELSVKVGDTTNLVVDLPITIEKVSEMKDAASSSAVGKAVIAYTTSNKKIADIDSKTGKIVVKKPGKVIITTKVKLYYGKTKTYKTTVTVK